MKKGFSLVEIVIVLVMIAITAAIALPRYASAVQRYRVDAAANHLAGQFDLAKHHARTTGKTVEITFDQVQHSVSLLDADDQTVGQTQLDESPFDALLVAAVPVGAKIFSYDGFGKANGALVVLISVGDAYRLLVIDADTGRTDIRGGAT